MQGRIDLLPTIPCAITELQLVSAFDTMDELAKRGGWTTSDLCTMILCGTNFAVRHCLEPKISRSNFSLLKSPHI